MFLRLIPLLASTLSIIMVYIILRKEAGWFAAIVGAILLATSPLNIRMSMEVSLYPILECASVTLIWAAGRATRSHTPWRWSLLILIVCVALLENPLLLPIYLGCMCHISLCFWMKYSKDRNEGLQFIHAFRFQLIPLAIAVRAVINSLKDGGVAIGVHLSNSSELFTYAAFWNDAYSDTLIILVMLSILLAFTAFFEVRSQIQSSFWTSAIISLSLIHI